MVRETVNMIIQIHFKTFSIDDFTNYENRNKENITEEVDCETFYRIISYDVTNNNIGRMIHHMSESMITMFEKYC